MNTYREYLKKLLNEGGLISNNKLTTKQRELLKLHVNQGFSSENIAVQLGISKREVNNIITSAFDDLVLILLELDNKKKKLKEIIKRNDLIQQQNIGVNTTQVKLSARAKNALETMGCSKLEDLTNFFENDLLQIPKIGKKTISEIKEIMKEYAISFK